MVQRFPMWEGGSRAENLCTSFGTQSAWRFADYAFGSSALGSGSRV